MRSKWVLRVVWNYFLFFCSRNLKKKKTTNNKNSAISWLICIVKWINSFHSANADNGIIANDTQSIIISDRCSCFGGMNKIKYNIDNRHFVWSCWSFSFPLKHVVCNISWASVMHPCNSVKGISIYIDDLLFSNSVASVQFTWPKLSINLRVCVCAVVSMFLYIIHQMFGYIASFLILSLSLNSNCVWR